MSLGLLVKTIILAGGLGTRFSEETENRPKPMILIDTQPILWHIMDIYASQGYSDFVIASGYKSEVIEEWVETSSMDWSVQVINTGVSTQTGHRIMKCIEKLDDDVFFATYGDGLGNINLDNLLSFHKYSNATVTVTAVRPPARFGHLEVKGSLVTRFGEKNQLDEGWINGGFFVMNRSILDFIGPDNEALETGALSRMTIAGELHAFKHEGFWFPMDTRSEQQTLTQYAKNDPVPWKMI